MKIWQMQTLNSISESYKVRGSRENLLSDSARINQDSSANVNISKEAFLKSLGEKYNVNNMSTSDMKLLALDLKDHSLISDKEYCDLTSVIKPIDGSIGSNANIDYERQYASQIEFSKIYSNKEDTKMLEGIYSILQAMK